MIFDNVRVLGYTHEHKFIGDNTYVLSRIKTINIKGYILDLSNAFGVKSIVGDAFKLQKECSILQDIVINGKNFGKGRAKSFSVDSGNWVRTTEYSATFEVYENINISQNISSKEFNDIDLNKVTLRNDLRLIKDFSESYNIDFDINSQNLTGSHSIEIQYISENLNSSTEAISMAKALASELLDSLPSNIFDGAYLYRADYIKNAKESYDTISKKCNFQLDFSYKADGSSNPYSINRTHSIEINNDGIISVRESGEIVIQTELASQAISLFQAIKDELVGAPSRCDTFFYNHLNKISSGSASTDPLNINKELQKSVVVNKVELTANYSIEYNNDQKRLNDKYILTRSLEMERSREGIWSIKETGSSNGVGKRGSVDKYNNAKLGWNDVSPFIESRILTFYNFYAKIKTGRLPQYVSKNITFAIYRGEIVYTVEYSDDPKFDISGDGSQFEIDVSDTGLINIVQDFLVPNSVHAIQQYNGLKKQGEQTVTVKLISPGNDAECLHKHSLATSSLPVFNSMTYFDILRVKAGFQPSKAKDGYKDAYLESIDYQSDEINRTAELTQRFKYS